MADNECGICIEKFNRSTRTKVQCYCGFSACKTCFKTYILSLEDNAHCMSEKCKIVYNRKFLFDNFGATFLSKDYKNRREQLLLAREMALMPVTQAELDLAKMNEKTVIEKKFNDFDKKIKVYQMGLITSEIKNIIIDLSRKTYKLPCPMTACVKRKLNHYRCNSCESFQDLYYDVINNAVLHIIGQYHESDDESLEKHINMINKDAWDHTADLNLDIVHDISDLKSLHNYVKEISYPLSSELQDIIPDIEFDIELMNPLYKRVILTKVLRIFEYSITVLKNEIEGRNEVVQMKTEKVNYIIKCPNPECKGLVTDTLVCAVCDTEACKECHEVKLASHICDENIKANIAAISADSNTKSCPGCAISISKIYGCDNMWCSNCHVFFKWDTLKLITNSKPHNPEYAAALARLGNTDRPIGDIQCGYQINYHFIQNLKRQLDFGPIYESNRRGILYYYAVLVGEICSNLHNLETDITRKYGASILDTNEYRKQILLNQMSEEAFMSKLQQHEKKENKKAEMGSTLTGFLNCAMDILYRLADMPKKAEKILKELYELRNITNVELKQIAKNYSVTVQMFNEELLLISAGVEHGLSFYEPRHHGLPAEEPGPSSYD